MFLTILKKLQCLSFLALVIFCEANSATPDFPGISLNESLHFGPATTRLVCTWDDVDSRNDERQTCFRIDFFQKNEWIKVGIMSVQVKGPQSGENKYYQNLGIHFGTYVRLHHVQIDERYRKNGIGTQAMKTFLDFYESKGGFDCFKLEACDWQPHLGMWYKKHGFIKKIQLNLVPPCIFIQKNGRKYIRNHKISGHTPQFFISPMGSVPIFVNV